MHHAAFGDVKEQPVDGREITEDIVVNEAGGGRVGLKASPTAGGERAGGGGGEAGELELDLARGEEVVGVEELDEVAAGEAQGVVTGGGGAGVGL